MESPDANRSSERLTTLVRFLLIFLPAAILLAVVMFLFYQSQIKSHYEEIQARNHRIALRLEQAVQKDFQSILSDLAFLATQRQLQLVLDKESNAAERHMLANEYLAFARSKGIYSQIRLVDQLGRERVRIVQDGSDYVIVPDAQLSDRSQRPFFRATHNIPRGDIFVSPFELDTESAPANTDPKPMIRFATPVFDRHGQRRGMVALNYLGTHLIQQFRAVGSHGIGQAMLVNSAGFWLIGNPDDEWGFALPDRIERSFARRYAASWQQMIGVDLGEVQNEFGLMVFKAVYPLNTTRPLPGFSIRSETSPSSARRWTIVMHASPALLQAQTRGEFSRTLWLYVALVSLMAILAVLLSRSWTRHAQAERALRASERHFRSVTQSANDAIISADDLGHIVSWNTAAHRMFGYATSEVLGQPIRLLMPERYHAAHEAGLARVTQGGESRVLGKTVELHGRRRDGTEFPVELSLGTWTSESHRCFTAIIRDITQRKAAQAEITALNHSLQQHIAQLSAANHELEAFSYSVSHDLRAPLRTIDGFSQALLEDYGQSLDTEGRHLLDRIRKATQRMGMLIDDMLQLARVSRAQIKHSNVDLGALAREIAADLPTGPTERRIDFSVDPDLHAHGDRRLLRIVLNNLLSNAWKFTATRELAVIRFGQADAADGPAFFIQDNGVGFDMQYADKLFGVFQRLHAHDEFEGTGVGLATVQRIIHLHGGEIWAESKLDEGTSFWFTLPPATAPPRRNVHQRTAHA